MKDFCKIFNSETYGQILVTVGTDDRGTPSVSVMSNPEGCGVCAVSLKFKDEDETLAWEKADKAFEKFDLQYAESMAEKLTSTVQSI